MNPDQLFIFTAPKHSGKTTLLQKWSSNNQPVEGILSPVLNGKRYFQDISNGAIFDMETDEEKGSVAIGKYRFSEAAFSRASNIIEQTLKVNTNGWLIIDELGPLELNKKGFYSIIIDLLQMADLKKRILLVVREGLVKEVIDFFKLDPGHTRIVTPEDDFFRQ